MPYKPPYLANAELLSRLPGRIDCSVGNGHNLHARYGLQLWYVMQPGIAPGTCTTPAAFKRQKGLGWLCPAHHTNKKPKHQRTDDSHANNTGFFRGSPC